MNNDASVSSATGAKSSIQQQRNPHHNPLQRYMYLISIISFSERFCTFYTVHQMDKPQPHMQVLLSVKQNCLHIHNLVKMCYAPAPASSMTSLSSLGTYFTVPMSYLRLGLLSRGESVLKKDNTCSIKKKVCACEAATEAWLEFR